MHINGKTDFLVGVYLGDTIEMLFYCIRLFCYFTFQALKARYENKPHDEAWHLLKSCHWNESHKVILKHIASDAIINGK